MIGGIGRGLAAFIGFMLVGILIASMWLFGWGFFQRATADFRGETEQIEDTRADGAYRIASYELFFDRCASIQSKETQIKSTEKLLADETDETRRTELNRNLRALENVRAELINQYNADARKEDTRGHFRSSDLPYEISIEGDTECTAE